MMYGLWRVAGREQKGACGIPQARWVGSEDLELFKFLFTKMWLGGGVVWFSGEMETYFKGSLGSSVKEGKSPLGPDKLLLLSLLVASGGTFEEISGSDRRKYITSFLLQSKEIVDLLFKHTLKPPLPSSHPRHLPSPTKRVK